METLVQKQTGWQRFKSRWQSVTNRDLKKLLEAILMTSQDLEKALNNQTTQIGKIALEQSNRFDTLTKTIADLTTAINDGTVTPAVTTALANTQAALDSLDAAIPDAPVA